MTADVRTIHVRDFAALARVETEWLETLGTNIVNRAIDVEHHSNCIIVTTETGERIRFVSRTWE